MSRLPVIVGFGGINPAGRSSLHHGYRRTVIENLDEDARARTFRSLAALMNLKASPTDKKTQQLILQNTLIRRLETNLFDADNIPLHKKAAIRGSEDALVFNVKSNQLPDKIPDSWQIQDNEDGSTSVIVNGELDVLFSDVRTSRVLAAGQLPTGFDPEALYQSRNHPRGLQLAIYGASDALNALGINWEIIKNHVPGDQVSVYASSAMGQLDTHGSGGLLQASLLGKRVSSKNLPLGLAEMTADFVNAYILGNVGTTGANIGACATFLYNLRQGIQDIR